MHPATFWVLFTVTGIWLQRFVPGVDFLAPGLVICLQDRRPRLAVWLALAWLVLQEGMGSMAFGPGVLWYGFLLVAYLAGRWLFEARNLLFMFIIGASMGLWHVALVQMMGTLQGLEPSMQRVALESIFQAAVFPAQWAAASALHERWVPHEHAI